MHGAPCIVLAMRSVCVLSAISTVATVDMRTVGRTVPDLLKSYAEVAHWYRVPELWSSSLLWLGGPSIIHVIVDTQPRSLLVQSLLT